MVRDGGKTPGYDGGAVVALRGELDVTDEAELWCRLAAVVSGEAWVIVDLGGLTFIDCSALRALVRARDQARLAGGDLLLVRPRGEVRRLLALTGLSEEFAVCPSIGQARTRAAGSRRMGARQPGRPAVVSQCGRDGEPGPGGADDS